MAISTNVLGSDFHCIDDIDPGLSLVQGYQCLGECIARRISTPRAALFYDKQYGFDARNFLKRPVATTQMAPPIENEALKDERVEAATAEVTYIGLGKATVDEEPEVLSVNLELTTADGPFAFVLLVGTDTITADILKEQH